MTVHPNITRLSQQERPARPQRIPRAAGAGRGDNNRRPPVCISYPQPEFNGSQNQQARRHLLPNCERLLAIVDIQKNSLHSPRNRARTMWEQSGSNPAQVSAVIALSGEEAQA